MNQAMANNMNRVYPPVPPTQGPPVMPPVGMGPAPPGGPPRHGPPGPPRQYGPPAGYQWGGVQASPQRPPYPAMPPRGMGPPPPTNSYGAPPPPRMPPQAPMGPGKRAGDRDGRMPMGGQPNKRPGGPLGGPGGPPMPPIGPKKKKKLADKILPQKVRDLVPESQAYMDLLAFERKLDYTITRKRLDIQEALKRPMKQKRKLRIFISNTFYPGKVVDGAEPGVEEATNPTGGPVPSWELRVEGRLLEDILREQTATAKPDQSKVKRKFSSFFKSLVIELDKDLYGPDNHLVEWHRTPNTTETDGFQVKRPGDKNVRCTILLLLDYQYYGIKRPGGPVENPYCKDKPLQFKLDSRLARLLGIHTQTRPQIISALWQYIKTHRLQDLNEREYINCDKYLEQIFQCMRMKFAEIPQRLHPLLHAADPIVINHIISVDGPDTKKTACYDIDVEVDDPLKGQMNNFLLSTNSQQEIMGLDTKIHETVETINQLKTNREFFLSFTKDPQCFISKWLVSQMRDLKTITDVSSNPEEERRSSFFYLPWAQEAVFRYFYGKVQQRRAELDQFLGLRSA